MAHFLRPLCVRRFGGISLLPRVRRLPDLLAHRTGTPSRSDGSVCPPCAVTVCVRMRSRMVQVFVRPCVSARRHVVVCEYEIRRANITRSETQMFVRLLVLLLRVQWCPLAPPSRRSSSNPAARRGIPAPAGAAAPDGGSFGGTVGPSLVCVNISNFSCCSRGCRRLVMALAVRGPPLVRLVSSEPESGP